MAFELSWNTWKLAITTGAGQPPRIRSLAARSLVGLVLEIKKAKQRLGLPEEAQVVSCYEAGRDGFWLHRFLVHEGVRNIVVDSASIEVNRRKRRAKSDRLDAIKLLSMLIRWHGGERKVWAVVRVPTVDDERGERGGEREGKGDITNKPAVPAFRRNSANNANLAGRFQDQSGGTAR
jgi:transposase